VKRIEFEKRYGPCSRSIFKKGYTAEFKSELTNKGNETLSQLTSRKSFFSNKTSKSSKISKQKSYAHMLDADDVEESGAYDTKQLRK